jgi:uncharacterized protein (TIGR00251 family)
MSWFKTTQEGVILTVRVVPRSSRNKVDGLMDDALKVRLQAPPVEGKANDTLVEFLAKTLRVSPSQITLLSGERARTKILFIRGIDPARVEKLTA